MKMLWIATALSLVAVGATGAIGFEMGTRYGEEPPQIEVGFVAPALLEERHSCPLPVASPPPDRHCPNLHERAVHAIGETFLADAYVRGAEDAHDSAEICERALEERWPPTDAACSTCRYWDRELELMNLNIEVTALDAENSHWYRACKELYRVWPTEPKEFGAYPADFPELCQ